MRATKAYARSVRSDNAVSSRAHDSADAAEITPSRHHDETDATAAETTSNAAAPEVIADTTARPQEGLLTTEEERDFKRQSRTRARKVFVGFVLYSIFISSLVASSYVVMHDNALQKISSIAIPKYAYCYVAAFVLLIIVARNAVLYAVNWHNWKVAIKAAQNIADVESVVDGFTTLFRRYVKTRAIGYYGYLWSVWGILTIAFYVSSGGLADTSRFALPSVILLSVITSLSLWISFCMSNHFKIGVVLVDFLGVIAYRSAHQMHTDAAQSNTRPIAMKHRKNHYWWFY